MSDYARLNLVFRAILLNGFFEKKLLLAAGSPTSEMWEFTFFDKFQKDKLSVVDELCYML